MVKNLQGLPVIPKSRLGGDPAQKLGLCPWLLLFLSDFLRMPQSVYSLVLLVTTSVPMSAPQGLRWASSGCAPKVAEMVNIRKAFTLVMLTALSFHLHLWSGKPG